ncbi:MAG: exodeoxyribonuclease VII large subunit [Oscillospiraceae bacterium]|nr:exodeoxyribonuclease VII large subunit [Oscillospiraceae bacterium]
MSTILTVSQINRYIASKLNGDHKLRGVLVSGEISGFTNHAKTGHLYFTLKDNDCAVKAVMFKSNAVRLQFAPQNGMKVIVSADVRVFERDGVYQLYVSDMQPAGLGALYLAFEQLKEKLLKEGIFDEAHKKPLPEMPQKIGIITSLDAAALQDMLNILKRRYPVAEVTVFPVLVQGAAAPESICRAIRYADSQGLDLLICGRGGGSPEDLAAFNDEALARCIYDCNTPIISAVGHETDTSISDLAADLRAPTPSAAAELAVPDMSVLFGHLLAMEKALDSTMMTRLEAQSHRLELLTERLEAVSPKGKLAALSEKISSAENRLSAAYRIVLQKAGGSAAERAARLDSLSPLKTLSRGYSIVYKDNKPVNSAESLSVGDIVRIRLSDGEVSAAVTEKGEAL